MSGADGARGADGTDEARGADGFCGTGGLPAVVAAVDPLLAPHTAPSPPPGEWDTRIDGDRGFTMEAVYEGFLLHYREPRAFDAAMDTDLRLLAGDAMYALGLERLATTGDLEAVAELADLISRCAQAQAEGRPDATRALWEATLAALTDPRQPGAPGQESA